MLNDVQPRLSEARSDDDSERDLGITADRLETKHVVPPELAAELAREVGEHLPTHHFRGAGATILPAGLEYATTIYFDTDERDLYREAAHSGAHLKLRAREYYSVHPALTDLATDVRELVRYTPLLWLEIKHRDGLQSKKRRLGIPKREVAQFFETGAVSAKTVELLRPQHGADAAIVLAEVAAVCRRYRSPLRPDCLVNYRRSAWQDRQGALRITMDRAVAFFAPPANLFTRDFALVRETLGQPAGCLGSTVIEIKARENLPEWLERILLEHALVPQHFSKFVAASRLVHG